MADAERERLAVHESGHVVVGLAESFGIESVSVTNGPSLGGFTRVARPPGWSGVNNAPSNWTQPTDLSDPKQRRWIGPAIRRLLAGDLAEARLTGDCSETLDDWGGLDDWLQVQDLLGMLKLADDDREAEIVNQMQKVNQVLNARWHQVEAIAEALLQPGRQTGRDIRHIILTAEWAKS